MALCGSRFRNLLSIEKMNQDHAKSRCAPRSTAAAVGAAVAGVAMVTVMLIAATPASAASRDFFGIDPVANPTAGEFETMAEAGAGTYRFQLHWATIQRTEDGPYDFSYSDALVGDAARAGLQPFPFLYGSPDWIGGSTRHPAVDTPEDREAWRQFVTAVVERYGPGGEFWTEFAAANPGVQPRPIQAYQILNEQNSPSYYEPKPSVKDYATVVEIADKAIAAVDHRADVVLGGMFGTPGRHDAIYSWKYLKKLYKVKGIKKHFDAVALHPYSPNLKGIKAQIRLVRKAMKKGKDKRTPIWITEIGWGSAGTGEHELIKTRSGQKKLLQKSFKLLLDNKGKWKIRRVMWFTWRDTGKPEDPVGVTCTWCASAGLLDEDLNPKPSFNVYRKIAKGG